MIADLPKEDSWIQRWNARYSSPEYVYGKEPNQFLKEKVRMIPGPDVLCIADGEGRNGVWLAKEGFKVTAIDYSEAGLEKSRELARESGVSLNLIQGDILTWDFGIDLYDAVVAVYTHFEESERWNLHQRYIQALHPGGMILMEVFSKRQLGNKSGGPKSLDMLYDCRSIQKTFPGMEEILLEEMIIDLDEGELHRGEASVIRVILRKPG